MRRPTNAFEIYLDIVRKRVSAPAITVQPSASIGDREFELPPKKEAVSMSIQKFNLREWLVPPILVPAFLGLLIAGAVICSVVGAVSRFASVCCSSGPAASVMIWEIMAILEGLNDEKGYAETRSKAIERGAVGL